MIIAEAALSFLGVGSSRRRRPGAVCSPTAAVPAQRLVGVYLLRPDDHAHRAERQPAQRLAARHPRPALHPGWTRYARWLLLRRWLTLRICTGLRLSGCTRANWSASSDCTGPEAAASEPGGAARRRWALDEHGTPALLWNRRRRGEQRGHRPRSGSRHEAVVDHRFRGEASPPRVRHGVDHRLDRGTGHRGTHGPDVPDEPYDSRSCSGSSTCVFLPMSRMASSGFTLAVAMPRTKAAR